MKHKHTCSLTQQELDEIYDSMADHGHCWGFIVDAMITNAKESKKDSCLACLMEKKKIE